MTTSTHAGPPIRDVLQSAVVSIDRTMTLRGAAIAMRREGIGALAVMDADEVQGIVTERDIVEALARGEDPDETRVVDVESVGPRFLTLADSVPAAAQIMLAVGCRHLPVVDDGVAIGIVSIRDVVRALLAQGS
ncbi:MAG: CBS domain-containing protein [Actinomycetota bacterium]|nr:CBS domain-containing protein [Actinomycetota bacterium]